MQTGLVLALLFAQGAAQAVVLDRIAVTVGKDVITESEVEQEIRVTAFVNGEPLDLGPEARRRAAERLVDQELVRRDMQLSRWPQPESSEAAKLLAELKRQRFSGDAQYRQALGRYGIAETDLTQHLLWQLAALRYTSYRFRPGIPPPGQGLRVQLEQAAQARAEKNAQQHRRDAPQARTDEDGATVAQSTKPKGGTVPPDPAARQGSVDEQMDAWLKDARSRTRIVYHEDAFR